MKLPIFTVLAGLMLALSSEAQTLPPVTTPPVFIEGKLISPAAEIGDYYPMRAADERIEGEAVVDCAVAMDGALTACNIVHEAPRGYGFGATTAAMFVKHYRVDPKSVEGGMPANAHIILTFSWKMG